MKINRFIVLAAIALLVVGALGFVTTRVYAQELASGGAQSSSIRIPKTGGIVEFVSGIEVTVDAMTGALVSIADSDDEDENEDGVGLQPAITIEQAQQAALAAYPGGTIHEIKLEYDDGMLVYKVEFTSDAEVYVDAMTGAVLSVDAEDEDEQGEEHQDEHDEDHDEEHDDDHDDDHDEDHDDD